MIYRKMDLLCQRLRDSLANGGVVELRKAYLAMTTDTLCGHAFDRSLDLLDEDRKADEWKRTIRAVAILTPLIKQFTWIIPLALKLPLGPLRMVVPDLARIVALHRVGTNTSNAFMSRFDSDDEQSCRRMEWFRTCTRKPMRPSAPARVIRRAK